MNKSRSIKYYKYLDYIIDEVTKRVPEFTTISDDDPLVILLQVAASLSTSSSDYIRKYLTSMYMINKSIGLRPLHNLLTTHNLLDTLIHPTELSILISLEEDIEDTVTIPAGTTFEIDGYYFSTSKVHFIHPRDSEVATLPTDITTTDTLDHTTDELRGSLLGEQLSTSYTIIDVIEGESIQQSYEGSVFYDGRLELEEDYVHPDSILVNIDDIPCEYYKYSRYRDDLSYVFDTRITNNYKTEVSFSRNYKEYLSRDSVVDILYIMSRGVPDEGLDLDTMRLVTPIYYNGQDISDSISGIKMIRKVSGNQVDLDKIYNMLGNLLPTTGLQAITIDDYTDISNVLPGICISKAYDIGSDESTHPDVMINNPKVVKLVAAPYSGKYLTKAMRDEIVDYFDHNGIDLTLNIINPRYVPINLSIGVVTDLISQYEVVELHYLIQEKLNKYLERGKIDYGSLITSDDLTEVILSASDIIHHIDLLNFTELQLSPIELPYLGKVEIITNYSRRNVSDGISISDRSFSEIETYTSDNIYVGEVSSTHISAVDKAEISEERLGAVDYTIELETDNSSVVIEVDEFVRDEQGRSVSGASIVSTRYSHDPTSDSTSTVDTELFSDDEYLGTDLIKPFIDYYDY